MILSLRSIPHSYLSYNHISYNPFSTPLLTTKRRSILYLVTLTAWSRSQGRSSQSEMTACYPWQGQHSAYTTSSICHSLVYLTSTYHTSHPRPNLKDSAPLTPHPHQQADAHQTTSRASDTPPTSSHSASRSTRISAQHHGTNPQSPQSGK